jgi:FkbM family methyltransferase
MVDTLTDRLFVADIESEGRRYRLFHFDEGDHIFRIARDTGTFYEYELLASLGPYLNRHDQVIDVGANIGNHSIYFAGQCGCRVTAFESNPKAYELLRLNVEHNQLLSRIETHCTALGAHSGLGEIDTSKAAHNLGAARVKPVPDGTVRIERLDDALPLINPSLIKIDVEGMELEILHGAQRTIERARPVICIEASTSVAYERALNFLSARSFLPLETHNFTPTHTFVPARGWSAVRIIRLLAAQSSRNYVYSAERLDQLKARMDRLQIRVTALEGQLKGVQPSGREI